MREVFAFFIAMSALPRNVHFQAHLVGFLDGGIDHALGVGKGDVVTVGRGEGGL
jgi:hypothetical protein